MLRDVLFGESLPALRQGLDVAALRQKVTADNIANATTPGFQGRHVVFEELFARQKGAHHLGLATPEGEGSAATMSGVSPRVEVDTSGELRSGVNNVDIEREMATLQRTSLMNSALTQMAAAKYRMIRQAISDRG